jgi:hypothetical protein
MFTHSSFILSIGLGMGNELWEEKSHRWLVVSNSGLFHKGMDSCVHENDGS